MRRFGVHPDAQPAADDDIVVAVFPRSMPKAEIARRVRAQLDALGRHARADRGIPHGRSS